MGRGVRRTPNPSAGACTEPMPDEASVATAITFSRACMGYSLFDNAVTTPPFAPRIEIEFLGRCAVWSDLLT